MERKVEKRRKSWFALPERLSKDGRGCGRESGKRNQGASVVESRDKDQRRRETRQCEEDKLPAILA